MRVRSVSAGRGLVLLKSIVVGRVWNAGHALLSGPGVFRGRSGPLTRRWWPLSEGPGEWPWPGRRPDCHTGWIGHLPV